MVGILGLGGELREAKRLYVSSLLCGLSFGLVPILGAGLSGADGGRDTSKRVASCPRKKWRR